MQNKLICFACEHLSTRALAGAMEENIKSGFFGEEATEDEEVGAAHRWGCNQYKCMPGCLNGKGTTREPKDTKQPRLFRVDQNADLHTQIVQLTEAIEKAEEDGVRLEAVIARPEFGELILQCGNPGMSEEKMKKARAEAKEAGLDPNKVSSRGVGVKHALEERHSISAKEMSEILLSGEVREKGSRLEIDYNGNRVVLDRKLKKGNERISKHKAKVISMRPI
ncbi:MAG: hypothetical protein Q4A24_09905 [Akkermansia sp.]|nr:hypothetical protein [Akkermansia sp.]